MESAADRGIPTWSSSTEAKSTLFWTPSGEQTPKNTLTYAPGTFPACAAKCSVKTASPSVLGHNSKLKFIGCSSSFFFLLSWLIDRQNGPNKRVHSWNNGKEYKILQDGNLTWSVVTDVCCSQSTVRCDGSMNKMERLLTPYRHSQFWPFWLSLIFQIWRVT